MPSAVEVGQKPPKLPSHSRFNPPSFFGETSYECHREDRGVSRPMVSRVVVVTSSTGTSPYALQPISFPMARRELLSECVRTGPIAPRYRSAMYLIEKIESFCMQY